MGDLAGRYSDGRTAEARAVTVRPTSAGLEIRGGDGLLVAFWQRGQVRVGGQLPGRQGVMLTCAADPNARLVVGDDARRVLAPFIGSEPRRRPAWRAWLGGGAAAVALAAGVWFGLPLASRHLAAWVPPAWERQIGTGLAKRLKSQLSSCSTPAGDGALTLLGARLGAMGAVRITVVRVPQVNAFALPGGEVLLFEGLLKSAESADEVAGVLAHEIAHVTLHHVTAAAIRGAGVGLLVTVATGDATGMAASAVATLLLNAYSRDDEAAADAEGRHLLEFAAVDPRPTARFFHRVAKLPNPPEWLSNHPDPEGRARLFEAAPTYVPVPSLPDQRWADLKAICGK